VVRNAAGDCAVPLRRLLTGPGATTLKPGDLVVELIIAKPWAKSYARFDKLGFRQAQVIAAVNFSFRARGRPGQIDEARVSWGSVAPTPVRSTAVEKVLSGARMGEDTIERAVAALPDDISPIDDHRASAAYRMAVARSYLKRALQEYQRWQSTLS
jgi:CO/xanthine dehydrogenase FAD-binding subunit